jgi:hypothetical protein
MLLRVTYPNSSRKKLIPTIVAIVPTKAMNSVNKMKLGRLSA